MSVRTVALVLAEVLMRNPRSSSSAPSVSTVVASVGRDGREVEEKVLLARLVGLEVSLALEVTACEPDR